MKKQLLFGVVMGIGSFAVAQSSGYHNLVTPAKLKASVAGHTEIYNKHNLPGAEADPFAALVNSAAKKGSTHPKTTSSNAFTDVIIGNTGYQLQTNCSVCNRVIKYADGTVSATWTYSPQESGWTTRGTGYNYFNGTSWGPIPTTPIENVRTGFTNIGATSNNVEVVVSHEASDLHMSTRAKGSTGAWTNAAFLGSPDVWSRLAVGGANGKTLHVISQTTGVGGAPFMGQDGAIAYSRSQDGGATWDKLHTVIPQIDANSYLGFGGDSYAIDAKGDTIVIVAGGFDVDVVMVKSTDNGETWTKTVVYPFAIPMYDATSMDTDQDGDGAGDTLETNNSSVAVLLDNQGKAHVWYGRMRVIEDPGGTGLSYFPGTDGLMYWNETMSQPELIAVSADIDGDGQLNIGTTLSQYQTGLITFPSAGIDATGNIYLSYAGIYEGIAEGGDPGVGLSYRHTYVMSSPDGGTTWCTPLDVTPEDYTEGVYGAMAKDVDGFVHLVVQQDGSPGNGLTGTTPDPQQSMADIVYKQIPVGDVLCLATSITEKKVTESSMTLFPNPANENANLTFTLVANGNVTINVYNVTGQVVSSVTNQNYSAGSHTINLDLEKYNSGMYFVNMITTDGTLSKKLMVK